MSMCRWHARLVTLTQSVPDFETHSISGAYLQYAFDAIQEDMKPLFRTHLVEHGMIDFEARD